MTQSSDLIRSFAGCRKCDGGCAVNDGLASRPSEQTKRKHHQRQSNRGPLGVNLPNLVACQPEEASACRNHQRCCTTGGGVHWDGHTCQPAFRFSAPNLIASSRVSSLRHYRFAEGCV
jgi:hypothetical protein